jgi:hypothetical protein
VLRAWLLEAMQNAPGPSISVDVKDIWLEDETLGVARRGQKLWLMCPACGNKRVTVVFEPPSNAQAGVLKP